MQWINNTRQTSQDSVNYSGVEERSVTFKGRPLMCQSYKYFEMSHLGKMASGQRCGDKSEPEKNLKRKAGSLVF